jgi:hypothetical protein
VYDTALIRKEKWLEDFGHLRRISLDELELIGRCICARAL